MPKRKPKNPAQKIVAFFSSYGLAVVLMLLLLALTYFGTMAQTRMSLYDASNKYFESLIIFERIGFLTIPLPGVYLVSGFLFVNILTGALIRARKSWRRPGMVIAHSGILYILAAGFVSFHYTKEGNMVLFEGDRSDEIYNPSNWSFEISKHNAAGRGEKIYLIDTEDLKSLAKRGARRVFHSSEIPFELEIYGYARNIANRKGQPVGLIREAAENKPADVGRFIEGLALAPMEPNKKEAGGNLPAAYIRVIDKKGEKLADTFVMGSGPFSPRPLTVEVGDDTWAIDLTRRRHSLPFAIQLEKFEKEDHPGTRRAREYSSDVIRADDGVLTDKYHISMNKPMRYGGFTAYQASWGPQDAGPGDPLYSSLAVAHNPADQWPKYGTYVIALGMAIHFAQKLLAYLKRAARSREPKEDPS
jgi:hypothetical protein